MRAERARATTPPQHQAADEQDAIAVRAVEAG